MKVAVLALLLSVLVCAAHAHPNCYQVTIEEVCNSTYLRRYCDRYHERCPPYSRSILGRPSFTYGHDYIHDLHHHDYHHHLH